jgi:ketosteroid isomerase-like protein
MTTEHLRALVDAYAVAVDERDADAFAALFTDDALLVVADADGSERARYDGRAAIAAIPSALQRFDRTFHAVTTHHCTGDGDQVHGVTYCEAHHLDGESDWVMHIRYDDDYVRSPEGWRFATRTVRRLWTEQREARVAGHG